MGFIMLNFGDLDRASPWSSGQSGGLKMGGMQVRIPPLVIILDFFFVIFF